MSLFKKIQIKRRNSNSQAKVPKLDYGEFALDRDRKKYGLFIGGAFGENVLLNPRVVLSSAAIQKFSYRGETYLEFENLNGSPNSNDIIKVDGKTVSLGCDGNDYIFYVSYNIGTKIPQGQTGTTYTTLITPLVYNVYGVDRNIAKTHITMVGRGEYSNNNSFIVVPAVDGEPSTFNLRVNNPDSNKAVEVIDGSINIIGFPMSVSKKEE